MLIEIHVFPFSFAEYCQYYSDITDVEKLFDDYVIKGGLAGSYAYRTEKNGQNIQCTHMKGLKFTIFRTDY